MIRAWDASVVYVLCRTLICFSIGWHHRFSVRSGGNVVWQHVRPQLNRTHTHTLYALVCKSRQRHHWFTPSCASNIKRPCAIVTVTPTPTFGTRLGPVQCMRHSRCLVVDTVNLFSGVVELWAQTASNNVRVIKIMQLIKTSVSPSSATAAAAADSSFQKSPNINLWTESWAIAVYSCIQFDVHVGRSRSPPPLIHIIIMRSFHLFVCIAKMRLTLRRISVSLAFATYVSAISVMATRFAVFWDFYTSINIVFACDHERDGPHNIISFGWDDVRGGLRRICHSTVEVLTDCAVRLMQMTHNTSTTEFQSSHFNKCLSIHANLDRTHKTNPQPPHTNYTF